MALRKGYLEKFFKQAIIISKFNMFVVQINKMAAIQNQL